MGDFTKWFSYYLMGVTQGSILNGHLHACINIRHPIEILEEELNYYKPDVLFCHMIFSENLNDVCGDEIKREELHELIAKTKKKFDTKIIYQEGDAKQSPRYPYPINGIVDLCLINSKCYGTFEKHFNVPCIHWPYFALNQETITSGDNLFRYQAIFTGNVSVRQLGHLHYGRYDFINALSEKIQLKIFPDENVGNTRFCTADVASSASAIVGIHHGHHVDGYLDTRPFQYCGAGALYFHSECDAIKQFFIPEVHYVQYEPMNVYSFIDKYKQYMIHDREQGNKIRQTAFKYTQKYHTAKHRVKMALDYVFKGRSNIPLYLKDIMIIDHDPEIFN